MLAMYPCFALCFAKCGLGLVGIVARDLFYARAMAKMCIHHCFTKFFALQLSYVDSTLSQICCCVYISTLG